MQGLSRLLHIRCSNARTVIGPQHNDLLMRQLRKHSTNIRATGPEHLLEAVLGETAGRIDTLLQNRIEQSRIKIIDRCPQAGEGQGRRGLALRVCAFG